MSLKETPSDYCRGIELQTPAAFNLELNKQTVAGFCQVADIRLPIKVRGGILTKEIVCQPMAQLDKTDPPIVSVVKEDETWVVRIDNNRLANKVRRLAKGDPKKFEAKYGQCFERALERGLVYCLIKEKIGNADKSTLPTFFSYMQLGTDLIIPWIIVGRELRQVEPNLPLGVIQILQTYGVVQALGHVTNFGISYVDEIYELKRLKKRGRRPEQKGLTDVIRDFSSGLTGVDIESSSLQDPFIRHHLWEIIMPVVPVDKLLAGVLYLQQHRNQLVELKFNLSPVK